MLLRAVADGHAGALNATKVKPAAAAVDSVSATGNNPPARPHPMTSQNQGRRTAVKGERSESAGHERSECP
jgi:hypothetical protein